MGLYPDFTKIHKYRVTSLSEPNTHTEFMSKSEASDYLNSLPDKLYHKIQVYVPTFVTLEVGNTEPKFLDMWWDFFDQEEMKRDNLKYLGDLAKENDFDKIKTLIEDEVEKCHDYIRTILDPTTSILLYFLELYEEQKEYEKLIELYNLYGMYFSVGDYPFLKYYKTIKELDLTK